MRASLCTRYSLTAPVERGAFFLFSLSPVFLAMVCEAVQCIPDVTITIAALVRRDDGGYAVPISPSWIHQEGVVCLVKGSVEVRDMEIAACTVLPFGDDEIDRSFDVGVVLMDGCRDVAVRDGGAEVICEPPFTRKAFKHPVEMVFVHCGYVVIYEPHR